MISRTTTHGWCDLTKNKSLTVTIMKNTLINQWQRMEQGKIGYALLWLLGIPLPVLLIFYLLRGGN